MIFVVFIASFISSSSSLDDDEGDCDARFPFCALRMFASRVVNGGFSSPNARAEHSAKVVTRHPSSFAYPLASTARAPGIPYATTVSIVAYLVSSSSFSPPTPPPPPPETLPTPAATLTLSLVSFAHKSTFATSGAMPKYLGSFANASHNASSVTANTWYTFASFQSFVTTNAGFMFGLLCLLRPSSSSSSKSFLWTCSRHPSGFTSKYIFTPRTSANPINTALSSSFIPSRFFLSANPSCKVPETARSLLFFFVTFPHQGRSFPRVIIRPKKPISSKTPHAKPNASDDDGTTKDFAALATKENGFSSLVVANIVVVVSKVVLLSSFQIILSESLRRPRLISLVQTPFAEQSF
mmetsp:Transcript_8058/g.23744  ORF Transcript_8058/g.23744 Transcript_8058/m.23744 type:complete len:353 (+) Transcript_8058:245-1303(+)